MPTVPDSTAAPAASMAARSLMSCDEAPSCFCGVSVTFVSATVGPSPGLAASCPPPSEEEQPEPADDKRAPNRTKHQGRMAREALLVVMTSCITPFLASVKRPGLNALAMN